MADEKNMFVDMEHEVMDFWEKEKCLEKLREKNRGHKMFRFLDGPITALSLIHIFPTRFAKLSYATALYTFAP